MKPILRAWIDLDDGGVIRLPSLNVDSLPASLTDYANPAGQILILSCWPDHGQVDVSLAGGSVEFSDGTRRVDSVRLERLATLPVGGEYRRAVRVRRGGTLRAGELVVGYADEVNRQGGPP